MHEGRGGETESSKVSGINGGKRSFDFKLFPTGLRRRDGLICSNSKKGRKSAPKPKKKKTSLTHQERGFFSGSDYTSDEPVHPCRDSVNPPRPHPMDLCTETRRDTERDKRSWQKKKEAFCAFNKVITLWPLLFFIRSGNNVFSPPETLKLELQSGLN